MPAGRRRLRRLMLAGAFWALAGGVAAGGAAADHHLIRISEVSAGQSGFPTSPYVELQMYSPSQTFLNGHKITTYSASGDPLSDHSFSGDVAHGENQRTVLMYGSQSMFFGDFLTDFNNTSNFLAAGGAVCFVSTTFGGIDCASWGSFNNTSGTPLPSPPGTPAPAMPANGSQALVRSTSRGCPNLLEATDDTNDSAADFELATPSARANGQPVTEIGCPNTNLDTRPADKSRDRTPTWTFSSTQGGSTFECRIDSKPFAACTAPKTFKVGAGTHTFRVRAVNGNGTDQTPATDSFKVLKKKRKKKR